MVTLSFLVGFDNIVAGFGYCRFWWYLGRVSGCVFDRSLPLIGRDRISNPNWNCMGEFGSLVGFVSLDSWHSIQRVQR